jgi:galactitol-specific phosphotransferase system IIC component
MDTVDIDVYEMWEMVLTELMAALSTRQNEGNSNVVNESNVSYGSSFESEG